MSALMNKRGQGTLETVMAFIIIIILVGGMVNIWFWFNNQMVKRQLQYNATRVSAGYGHDNYTEKVGWGAKPEQLTENQVLPR